MKKYIRNNEIRPASQIVCKVTRQEELDGELQEVGYDVYNPSEAMILSDGWEPYDNREETYEERVAELVRERYSLNQELAILRQRDTKPSEFVEYDGYVEDCKSMARKEVFEQG